MLRTVYEKIQNFISGHKLLSYAIVCCLGLLLYWGCRYSNSTDSGSGKLIVPIVHTQLVEKRPLYKEIALFGEIKPLANIDIINKYAGVIDSVNVELGDRVRAGELLLQQELTAAAAEVLKRKARYQEADATAATTRVDYNANKASSEADYQLAKLNYERYQRLYDAGAVSKYELDTMRQTMVNKKAAYEELAAQSSYEGIPSQVYAKEQTAERRYQEYLIAQEQYRSLIFKAPRNGVITYRNAEAGAYAAAGTKLLTLLDDSSFIVDCEIAETDAVAVRLGTAVELTAAAAGQAYHGTIIYVSPARNYESNSYSIRIRLDKPDEKIKAGLFVKGSLRLLQKENIIYLDKNALVEKNGSFYVYIINKEQRAEKRKVSLGVSNSTEAEIVNGLAEGEIVITDNLSRITDGADVKVAGREDEK